MSCVVALVRTSGLTCGNQVPVRGRSCLSSSTPSNCTGSRLPRHDTNSKLVMPVNMIRLPFPARLRHEVQYQCAIFQRMLTNEGIGDFGITGFQKGADRLLIECHRASVLDDAVRAYLEDTRLGRLVSSLWHVTQVRHGMYLSVVICYPVIE